MKCRRGFLHHEVLGTLIAAPTRGQALPSAIAGCGKSCIARHATAPLHRVQRASSRSNCVARFARMKILRRILQISSKKFGGQSRAIRRAASVCGRSCDLAASNVAGVLCTMKRSVQSVLRPPEVRRCPLPSRVAARVASPSKPQRPCNVSIKPHLALTVNHRVFNKLLHSLGENQTSTEAPSYLSST